MALYTIADTTTDDPVPVTYVCCALPASDVLRTDPEKVHQVRDRRCAADEVMTGAADTHGAIFCTAINAAKYALRPAKLVCAGAAGGPFGIGGRDCGGSAEILARSSLPGGILALLSGSSDQEVCVGVPFGALIVGQSGHRCEDAAAATLVRRRDGAAIKIFP